MQAYRSSALLKTMAKGQLLGKYPIAAATSLLVGMITIMLQMLSFLMFDHHSFVNILMSYAVSLICGILLGVIHAGIQYMSLKVCCDEPIGVGDIFYGFSYHPNKIVAINFVLTAVALAANLPATIFQSLFAATNNTLFFMLNMIFLVLGIGIEIYVYLLLSQAVFLLLDFEDYQPKELMQMSIRLMKGHKGRLFYIWASFIPLVLLGLLTCCIGYIWMTPYANVTMANFYMDLAQNKSRK